MEMTIKSILSVSLILFSVIDILGGLPVVLSMKNRGQNIHSRRASIIAGALMISFLLIGESLLGLFGVDIQSFALAGALIIFLIGLEMILGITLFKDDPNGSNDGTIVPLAFPLIAGAGTLTTILSLKSEYDSISIGIGIVVNMMIVWAVLHFSDRIGKVLGNGGLTVLRKVFGIILLAIAIKLVKGNVDFIA